MNNGPIRFPVTTWRRIWNRRGPRAVNCVLSDRYLLFGAVGQTSTGYYPENEKLGTPVSINVMTGAGDNDRKLCEIVLTIEALKEMVSILERERDSED